jgi:redox-sensitive bicupin YhaK (pirin superfamily)
MGNGSRIEPGDVQFMSAGSGVTHSEFNGSQETTVHLLQMWVIPAREGTSPSYDQKHFDLDARRGRLCPLVSSDGRDGTIVIGQDVNLYSSVLAAGESVEFRPAAGRAAWLHLARGQLTLNGTRLGPGDGAGIRDEERLTMSGLEEAEMVLFDLP